MKSKMLWMHQDLAGQSTMLVQHCSKTKLVPTNVADAVYKSDHRRYIRQHTAGSEGSTTLYSLADIRNERSLTCRLRRRIIGLITRHRHRQHHEHQQQ